MYSSFCNNCNRNWSNLTSNCPYCGAPDHNAIHDQDKDTNMNEKTDFSSIVAESMKVGAALAVASEANNLITAGTKMALVAAGVPPKALESALFEKGTPIVGALLVLYAAERFPDMVPQSEFVTKAAQLALTEATKDTLAPMLQQASPMLMALAASGQKMAKLEAAKNNAGFEEKINDDDEDEIHDVTFEINEL